MTSTMKTSIGRFDRTTGTVPVTFEQDGKQHERPVNAVIDADGKHDRAATVARVAEVSAGVAEKFALGLLGSAPSDPVDEEQAQEG